MNSCKSCLCHLQMHVGTFDKYSENGANRSNRRGERRTHPFSSEGQLGENYSRPVMSASYDVPLWRLWIFWSTVCVSKVYIVQQSVPPHLFLWTMLDCSVWYTCNPLGAIILLSMWGTHIVWKSMCAFLCVLIFQSCILCQILFLFSGA